MRIHDFYYNDDTRRLYIEFSIKSDYDKFYRILDLDYTEIEYYSPEIITEDDLSDVDESFVVDLINEYIKENDLPDEIILWYLLIMGVLNDNKKKILNNFVKFVKKELDLKSVPTISIQNTRDGLKTTANYDYTKENKIIKVYGKGRALVDIMRSVAHEMVHHKQYEQGRLEVKPPDIGGEIEDEANAKAGQFIKMYAKEDPTIYDD